MNFWLWLSFLEVLLAVQLKSFDSDRCLKRESNVDVIAVLVPCHPHASHINCHSAGVGKFVGLDGNEIGGGKLKHCVKKLLVSVLLTNQQNINTQSEYVVIDEVYDCQTAAREKILYPYVLKIKRQPLLQTYRLDFEGSVKEKSRIIEGGTYQKKSVKSHCNSLNNNRMPWFDLNDNDGHSMYRKKRSDDEQKSRKYKNIYDFDTNMNAGENYQSMIEEDKLKKENLNREKRDPLNKKELPFGVEGEKDVYSSIEFSSKNEESNCLDERVSQNTADISSVEENLDTNNMKYYIYKLREPSLTHNLSIEIFEKHTDLNENIHWNTITDEKPIILSTTKTESWGPNKSYVASYSLREGKPKSPKLPYDNMRLLIPQFPYLRGGPEGFLVIPENVFSSSEEFHGQRAGMFGRNVTESTSMKHPPIWFRQADLEKEEGGYDGNFFLKYFAKLPENPLVNASDDSRNLTIRFQGSGQTNINLEIKADFNIILKQHSSAVITEVYVDSTNVKKTEITVKVTNSGLVDAVFYVFLTDCPLRLPADFSNIATSSAVISPQQQHVFSLTVLFALPKKRFYCSIDVKNHREDVIAFRRIRFQRHDRCVCMWHCSCTCLDTDRGLKCKPLPIDHYNAAGFHGGLPMASRFAISSTFVHEYFNLFLNLCLVTVIILFLMGVIKALLGICCPSVGSFGLRWYLGLPRSIDEYYESNLKKRPEQYDTLKWPIHPDVKYKSRITTLPTEISINFVFFLFFPLIILHAIVIKLFTPRHTNEKLTKSTTPGCKCPCYGCNSKNTSRPASNEQY